jgi:hypothetical protein
MNPKEARSGFLKTQDVYTSRTGEGPNDFFENTFYSTFGVQEIMLIT